MKAIVSFIFFLSCHLANGGPCSNVVFITNSWPGGYTAGLNISITSATSSWTIGITMSTAISSLEVWNAVSSTTNSINFTLKNMDYNGVQNAGTQFNSVGFNVRYPSSDASPTINVVTFNGVNICSTATTAAATTTTMATITSTTKPTTTVPSTATTSATTASNSGSCNTIAPVTRTWPGGVNIQNLYIPISSTITSWNMVVTFSAAITSLEVWNTAITTTNKIAFSLSNVSYNGAQNPGTVFSEVGFNVNYPSSNPMPEITNIMFNGVNICTRATTVTTASVTITSTTPGSVTPATTTTVVPITTTSGVTTTSSSITTVLPIKTKYNYSEVITKSLLFYYAQRSGRLPLNDNPIPYRGDSALGDVGQNNEDLTGGYYDAGDFVKFGFPMAGMTTVVAWSLIDYPLGYSSARQLTNGQNMVKWASDYFIKAHVSPNKFYGQVGDGGADHSYWGRPEDMTMARPAYYISNSNPGSDLAGETAAAMAATSMVFSQVNATYSAICLSHAKDLYNLAKQYPGIYSSSISQSSAFYSSSGYGDELAWAAIWLYRATLNLSYLNDAKAFSNQYGLTSAGDFSWDNKAAGVQVLLAKMTNETAYINAIKSFCDSKVNAPKTPKGLLFISEWGSLRHAANDAFICLQAADININSLTYRQFAQKQIHYALGDTGRSFVAGFGTNPPVRVHHRSSSCPNRPATCDWNTFHSPSPNAQILYGGLVGGPDINDNYSDDRSNYKSNEVATDYNAGFQGAVAALQSLAVKGVFV